MGFFDFLDPDRQYKKFSEQTERKLWETAVEISMIEQGWSPIPDGMTDEERQTVIDACRGSGKLDLYPLGYIKESVITEGKLELEPEKEEERKWWQFW